MILHLLWWKLAPCILVLSIQTVALIFQMKLAHLSLKLLLIFEHDARLLLMLLAHNLLLIYGLMLVVLRLGRIVLILNHNLMLHVNDRRHLTHCLHRIRRCHLLLLIHFYISCWSIKLLMHIWHLMLHVVLIITTFMTIFALFFILNHVNRLSHKLLMVVFAVHILNIVHRAYILMHVLKHLLLLCNSVIHEALVSHIWTGPVTL